MGRIMAIDYGKKRVGLAVTDELQIVAQALTTVDAPVLLDFLQSYVAKEEVEAFVLGMPIGLDGQATHGTPLVEAFSKQLAACFPNIPIHMADERFTSKLAVRAMVAGGMKKKDRRNKANIDKISAAILLQDYMASKR